MTAIYYLTLCEMLRPLTCYSALVTYRHLKLRRAKFCVRRCEWCKLTEILCDGTSYTWFGLTHCVQYLHLLWLERSYHATSFPGSSPTRVKKGPWERGCLPRVLLCQTRLYSLTVTWGMCSFVITCFITSIGHGEPAMTPNNEELQRNLLTCQPWCSCQ